MQSYAKISTLILAVVLVTACAAPATPTEDPNSQTDYPLDTKTGIQDIDPVLAAVASGDQEQLRAHIHYTTAPCTTAEGFGGPPKCSEGEAEGTLLEVMPVLGSEGGFFRSSEINTWTGIDATAIYAIYRVDQTVPVEQYYPSGEYAVMYISRENPSAVSLRVVDGGIVRVDYILDTSPEVLRQTIERDAAEVILAPKNR